MHAVVEIAGKQFRVANNDKVKVPLLDTKEGGKVNFDKIHMIEDDKGKVTIGSPLVSNMAVGATVLEHGRDAKIIVFKKKRRKGYQKKNGHKQGYSLIEINTIGAGKASTKKAAAEKPAPAKAEAKPVKKATKSQAAPKKAATTATKSPAKKVAEPKKATAEKKETAKKSTATKKAAPKKTETVKKTTTAAKPKATKTAATKPKTAAKKAEPKPKAKED